MDFERILPGFARKSIIRKYSLLVLAVLVFTGAVTAIIVSGVGDTVRDNRQEELQTTAQDEAERLGAYYRDQRDRASLVSENGEFEEATTTQDIQDSLDAQRENFENRELIALHYVNGSTATIRASTLANREGEPVGEIPWQDGLSFDGPNDVAVSSVYAAPSRDATYVAFASPVEGKGDLLVAVLNATARGMSLRDTVAGGYTQVVDSRGEVQFANRRADVLKPYAEGTNATPLTAGLDGQTGITTRNDLVIAYTPVNGTDLVVIKHAPAKDAYALSNRVTEQLIFLVSIVTLGFVLLITVVYRDLVVPIVDTTRQTRRLAAGDIDVHPPDDNRIDEVGQFRDGVREIAGYLRTTTTQAEVIAEQDFDSEVFTEEIPGRLGTALREMKTNLEEAITELEQTVQQLEASNDRLQQFAYVASHDLQEPARMVSSYVTLLDREYGDQLDEEAQEYMDFAIDGADRMQAMIDGLLDYSRVRTQAEDFAETDADEVLSETLQDLQLLIDDYDVTVTHDTLPPVESDRNQLGQVLQNLIENAIEHGGDEIHVGAHRRDGEVVFSVEDNGEGIPENRQERIFELFEQGHRDNEGTGIGLAICDRIVSRHGGNLWVDSEEGDGTTFSFTMPACE